VDADLLICPKCKTQQDRHKSNDYTKCSNPKCQLPFSAATWLFEGKNPASGKPHVPNFKKPLESFTTALFALYLLHPEGNKSFPIRVVESGYKCRLSDKLELKSLVFYDLSIEQHGKPDLIIHTGRQVIHIENKPGTAGGRGLGNSEQQIPRYHREARESGADFYVLISCGNPHDDLWSMLAEDKVPIILWEEVLLRMDQAKFAVHLSPTRKLKPYYKSYLPR
jgi:hypothetical protein